MADMKPFLQFQSTTDQVLIQEWAKFHSGKPQLIDNIDAGSDQIGLRINFPGKGDDVLLSKGVPARDVTWQDFFKQFEKQQLSFLFIPLDQMEDGQQPENSYRLINRAQMK